MKWQWPPNRAFNKEAEKNLKKKKNPLRLNEKNKKIICIVSFTVFILECAILKDYKVYKILENKSIYISLSYDILSHLIKNDIFKWKNLSLILTFLNY